MAYSRFEEPTFVHVIVDPKTGMLRGTAEGHALVFKDETAADTYWKAHACGTEGVVCLAAVVPVNPEDFEGRGDDLDEFLHNPEASDGD